MTSTKSTVYSRRSQRAGLTLLEVVAAIAILGTILVGVVLAKVNHARQLALAEHRLGAINAADELISTWWLSTEGVPVGEAGKLPLEGQLELHWRTTQVPEPTMERLGMRVVRVTFQNSPAASMTVAPHDGSGLLTVDLVLPGAAPASPPAVSAPSSLSTRASGSRGAGH